MPDVQVHFRDGLACIEVDDLVFDVHWHARLPIGDIAPYELTFHPYTTPRHGSVAAYRKHELRTIRADSNLRLQYTCAATVKESAVTRVRAEARLAGVMIRRQRLFEITRGMYGHTGAAQFIHECFPAHDCACLVPLTGEYVLTCHERAPDSGRNITVEVRVWVSMCVLMWVGSHQGGQHRCNEHYADCERGRRRRLTAHIEFKS